MPYLVAKNFYQHGCYAMPVEHGPELVELKHDLQAATSLEHLQLVTISRPAAYGEYAPYTIVKDREEFIRLVLQMKPCFECFTKSHFPAVCPSRSHLLLWGLFDLRAYGSIPPDAP